MHQWVWVDHNFGLYGDSNSDNYNEASLSIIEHILYISLLYEARTFTGLQPQIFPFCLQLAMLPKNVQKIHDVQGLSRLAVHTDGFLLRYFIRMVHLLLNSGTQLS